MKDTTTFRSTEDCRKLCQDFARHFTVKICGIKSAIQSRLGGQCGDPLQSDMTHGGPALSSLSPPTVDEVKKIISSMPAKSMDDIPTSVIKSNLDIFASLIARLTELSFEQGIFPARYKTASVTPLLKKKGDNVSNFRQISNLHTVSYTHLTLPTKRIV